MRGVESLAYDLDVRVGRVNSRVALLLRSIERNPTSPRFDFFGSRPLSHRFMSGGSGAK